MRRNWNFDYYLWAFWTNGTPERLLLWAPDFETAHEAYQAAMKRLPHMMLRLLQGHRTVREYRPGI